MPKQLEYKPLSDGDIFDLGAKKLEVVTMPGHTRGSVAFINQEDNYALVSDCFSFRTAMVNMPTEKRLALTNY